MTENNTNHWALAAALAKAQAEFPLIEKNRTAEVPTKAGGKYSYKYADLADVLNAVRPVLAKYELAITQGVEGEALVTRLLHSSGEILSGNVPFVAAQGYGPQAVGSALTYARRYGLCAVIGITAEEDDDGQTAEASAQPKPKVAAPAKGTASSAPSKKEPKVYTKEENEKALKLGFDNAEKHASMVKLIWIKVKEAGLTKEDVVSWCVGNTKPVKESSRDLNWVEINALKKDLEKEISAKKYGQREPGAEG